MIIEYQNTQEDYREMSDAIIAARRPINSPMQIVIIALVFGAYYFLTSYLWQKTGVAGGQLAWINMWIAVVAFGFTWLAMTLPASFRARPFPWLNRRQFIALGSFLSLIGALIFQHWFNQKYNPNTRSAKLTWQLLLPHSIWLTILIYVGIVASYNHKTSLPRHWKNRPDLHRHQTLDISAAGLIFSDLVSRHEYQWSAFIKGEETKNLFLLFPWESASLIVPKRAFNSEEELAAMRNLMELIPDHESRGFAVTSMTAQPPAALSAA